MNKQKEERWARYRPCRDLFIYICIYFLLQSPWAAIAEYHRVGGLNNRHCFLTVLESGKSKIKVPVVLVSDKSPLPIWQTAVFSFIFTWLREESFSFCLFSEGHKSLSG